MLSPLDTDYADDNISLRQQQLEQQYAQEQIERENYENSLNESRQNAMSTYEYAKAYGVVNKYLDHFVETQLTTQQKLEEVQKNALGKTVELEGGIEGELLSMPDADTGKVRLPDGSIVTIRLHTGSSALKYDAIDERETLTGENGYAKSQRSTALQVGLLADLAGKSPFLDSLSKTDFDNYHNWSTIERQKSLNEKDPVFEPYDPNKKYEQLAPEALSKKKVYLKVYDQDKYGRYVAEMINPDTGRSVGFDSALNPYENTRFKLLDSIDTPRNRERIRRFEAQQKSYADMLFEEAAKHDSDGRLAEDGDLIKSAAYQMAARVLQHVPGLDEPYWQRIAKDQRWADLAAGVSKHTRDDFQKKAQQISNLIEAGKLEEATLLAFTQVDRFLAESTPQMALLIAGSYLAGGALSMAGITAQGAAAAGAVSTVAYKLTKAFAGATLAGIDKTLTDVEDYKKNNDGQSMSMEDYAKTFLLATISLVPEEFILGMVGNGAKTAFGGAISRLLGRPVTNAAVEPTAKILGRAAGRLGFGAVAEYSQERLETAIDTAASARRDAKYEGILKETLKAFDTPENRQAGLVGGVMGFTLGGATNVISVPFEFRKNDQIQNYVNNVQHNFRNQTAEEFDPNINEKRTSSNIDTKASDDILKRVTEHSIPVQESSSKQIVTEIRNLEALSANSVNLRADSATALQNRLTELYKELATRVQNSEEVKQAKTPEERTKAIAKLFAQQANATPETAFRKIVYGARPELIGGIDPIKGTRLSKDDIEAKKEELTELGKNLGLSEDFVARTLEEVNDDIRYGYNGFQTAIDNINIIRAEASNKKNKKKDFTPQLTRNIKQIVRLLAYQSTKLRQFADTAKSISDENKSSTQMITFPSGQQFELNGEVLAALGLSEDKGPNRVVNSIVKDIAEMKDAINSLNKKEKAILEKAISDFNRFNEYHINYDLTEQTDESLKQYKEAIALIQTKSTERFRKNLETSTNNSDNIDIYPIVNNLSRLADATLGKINLKDKDKLARINSIRALNENQVQRLKDHLKDAKYNDEKKARMLKALDDILSSKAESDAIAKTFDDANKEYREKAKALVESFTPKDIKSLTINDDETVKAKLAEFNEVLNNFKNITDEDSRIYGKLQSNWTLFKRKLESLSRAKQEQARREQAKKETEEKTKKSEESKQESEQESKQDSKQESKQDSKPASKKPSFKDTATKLLNKIANIRNNLKNLNTEGLQKLHDEVKNEFIHLSEQFPDMNMNNLRTTVSNFLTDARARLGKQPTLSTPTSEAKSNTTQESKQTSSETKSEAVLETKSEPKSDVKSAPKFAKTLEDGRNKVKVVMGGIRKSLNSNNMTVQGLTAVRNNIYNAYSEFITSFPEGNVDPLRTSVNNLIHDIDVRIRNMQATPASTKSKTKTKPSLTVAQGKKNIHTKIMGMRNSLKKNTSVEGLKKLQNDIQQEYAKLVAMFPNVNMGETHTSVVNLVNDIQRKINKLTNTVEKAPEIPSKAIPAFEQGKIPETKEKPLETKSEPSENTTEAKEKASTSRTFDNQFVLPFLPDKSVNKLIRTKITKALMQADTQDGYTFYIASKAAEHGFTISPRVKQFIKKYGKQLGLPTELITNLDELDKIETSNTPTMSDFVDEGKYAPTNEERLSHEDLDYIFSENNSSDDTQSSPKTIDGLDFNETNDIFIYKIEIDILTQLVTGLKQGKTTNEVFTEYANQILNKEVEKELQKQSKATSTSDTEVANSETSTKVETATPNTQDNAKNESKPTPDTKNEDTENADTNTDSTTEETNVSEEEETFEYDDEVIDSVMQDEEFDSLMQDEEFIANGELDTDVTDINDAVIDEFNEETKVQEKENEETDPNMSLLEKVITSITKGIKNLGISISAYEKLMYYRLQLRDAINDYKQNHEVVKTILDKGEELIGRITKQELKTAAEYNRSRANRIDGILPIIYTNTSEATNETVLTNKDGLLVYYMNPDGSAKLSNYDEFIKYLEKDSKDILDVLKFMDVHSSKSIGRDFKEYNKLQEEFKKTKDKALLEEYGKARDERINIGETTFYSPATLQSVIDIAVREDMTNADKKALQQEVQDNIRTFLLLYEKAKMRYNINEKSTLEQRTQAFTSAVEEYTSFAKHNFYVEDTVSKNSLISKLLDAERNSMVTFSPSKNITNFDLNNEVVIRSPECVLATSPTNLYSQKRLSQAVTKIATQMNLGTVLKKEGIEAPLGYLTYHNEEIGSSPLQQAPHYQFLYQIFKNNDGTVAFNANQFVFEIVDFSVKEYVATMGLSDKLTKSMPKSAVARMFGLNDETLSYSDIGKLRKIVKDKGIPKGAIVNALGSLILRNLGIRPNKNTGTREFYARLITGFGLFGLQYLSTAGIIKNNAIPHKVLEDTGISEFSKSAQEFDAVDSVSNGELVDTGVELESSGVDIPTIQIVENGKPTLEAFKTQFKTQLKEWKHQTPHSNEPRWSPTKIKDTNYVRHTEDLIEVPDVVQSTMDKLSNNAYEFDNELTEVVLKNKDNLKQRLGYVETDINKNPEFAHLSYDEQESIKGRNLDIENEIESMENAFNEQRNRQTNGEFEGIYFNWFMSKNGRLFIDSNTLNPQVNKTQRFLCMPKLSKGSFDVNNSEHLEAEAFAIAQAFDVLDGDTTAIADKMRSLTVEQLQAVQQALFELDGKAFEAWTDKHLGMELGIENLGQCLNVLQHLIRRKQSDGKVFDTWLAIENDSTTSGYAIRFFNIPFEDVMEEFGPKTGILDNKTLEMFKATSMHGLKQSSNFLDIYKTIAKDAVTHLPTKEMAQDTQEMQELYKKYFKKNMNLTLTDKALAQFAHLYETLFNALPGLENGKVSKNLRTLMKPAVMTFGYTAGDKSIIRKLVSELTSGDGGFVAIYTRYKYAASLNKNLTYEQFAKTIGKSADHIKAVMDTMGIIETLIDTKDGTLLHQLKTKTIGEIAINLKIEKQADTGKTYQTTRQVTLDQYFNHILYPTVGEAVTSSLDKSFAAYKQINDYMNYMTVNMFNLFDFVYKAVLDDAQSKGPLTTAQYKKLIDSLKDIFPTIDLGYGKNIDRNDGRILLTSFQKSYSDKIKATNWETEVKTVKGSDGKPVTKEVGRQRTAHADMRTFANPRKSGAVIPVHGVDGMILLLTMLDSIEGNGNVSFTPVHDAVVMSALHGLESTRSYNGNMYLVNKEYNIFNEIFSKFQTIADVYENKYRKQFPNLPALETLVAKTSFGRPIESGDATVNTSYNEALAKGYITKAEYDKAITSIMRKDKKIKNKKEAGETKADFETFFTIPLLLEKAQVHNDKIQQARDAFYDSSNVIHVMNMDGQAGTNVEINSMTPDSITEATVASKVHQAIGKRYQKKYGATSNGFVTSGQTAKLLQDAKTDKKARIQLLHALNGVEYAKGNPTIDPEHMKHLETILERIDPAYLEDLKVQLYESTYNTGRYTPSTNTVDLFYGNQATQLDSVTKAAIESTMSMAEVYAHELTHAGLEFAFSQNLIDRNLFAKEIRQLSYLHTEASAQVTWEDFMPKEGTYDPALKDLHEKQAKITYDYIFKNTDKNNPLAGLAEFCAYGITNPRLMEKLKSISTTAKQQQKENFIVRLLKTIKALFSAAFNKQKAGDLLPYLLGVTKGITSRHRNQNIYQELDRIVGRLHSADNRAANSILRHPVKAIELAFKAFDIVRRFGNRIISPMFNFIWYANDTFKVFKEADLRAAKIGETGLDIARKISTSMLLSAISSTHRKYLKNMILAFLRASHTSTFGSIINDITATDEATDQLQLLGLRTRLIDAASKQREADMYSILSSSFEKTLSTLEEESLHDVVLRTDLQSLLDETTSVSDIISMLKNKDEVQARIAGIESTLAKESGYTKEQLTWVKNQSRFLARYMTTGIGCECLNLNARQIAKGVYCPTKLDTDGNEKIISLIDKLTSLYALNSTNDDMKTVVSTLSANGLDTFLSAHKTFVKDSYEGIQVADSMNGADIQHPIEAQHVIKGYTKQLFDTSYEIRVEYADSIMEGILAKEGFVKQKTLPANKLTKSTNPMAIYRREYATPRRRDGASFITTSSNSIGTSLMDNAYNTAALESRTVTGYKLWKIYKDRGMKLNQHISKQMTKKLLTEEEMDRMSANYTPIYSPKTNSASDFRISMEHQTKKDILGADTRGLTVLSKMYATQLTKIQANARNEAVLQFLINDYKENGPKTSSNMGKNANPYVKLAKNSDNEFVRDAYNAMPTIVQEYIKKNELYVREDWLRMLFGTPTASITDTKVLNKITGIKGKRAIHIVEALLRFLASEVKRKIVNMPKVVIGNIMSNFTYSSIMQGRDPYKVFKMQIENARNIRLYTTLTHEYNQLELKRRMGKSEPNTEARMVQLARQIERNPVAPLVERGFYQSIVEDIRPEEMESTGSIHKYFKNTKIFDKIPNLLKTVGKNVYMTEGTPIYDFLFTITQYSDFVARATEYQLLMEKAPDKDGNPSAWKDYEQQATRTVLNTFINYDKPQSTVEQYLNDHGITWFTKFAKRIQPIINGQILHNPMGVLGMLLFQHTVFDAESIVEQNMFMKHWLYLGRNPYDNFIDALIPMSYTTFIK